MKIFALHVLAGFQKPKLGIPETSTNLIQLNGLYPLWANLSPSHFFPKSLSFPRELHLNADEAHMELLCIFKTGTGELVYMTEDGAAFRNILIPCTLAQRKCEADWFGVHPYSVLVKKY